MVQDLQRFIWLCRSQSRLASWQVLTRTSWSDKRSRLLVSLLLYSDTLALSYFSLSYNFPAGECASKNELLLRVRLDRYRCFACSSTKWNKLFCKPVPDRYVIGLKWITQKYHMHAKLISFNMNPQMDFCGWKKRPQSWIVSIGWNIS